MTRTVYGIRLIGSHEPRYIGQTRRALDVRLYGHIRQCKCMPGKTDRALWFIANEANLEIFEIAKFDDADAAREYERNVIAVCAAVGHRLFNIHHVPKALMIPRAPYNTLARMLAEDAA